MGCAHTPTSESTSEIKVPRITKEEVKSMVGNPNLIILDVRSAQYWKDSEWKIKGAVREDRRGKSSDWVDKYPKDKTLVLYCA
jgi:rhodanese-related sulfurtransferase